jgi:Predicted integral membrane protein (DUF2269)
MSETTVRHRLPRRARHTVLTAHIVMSVALLGDSAGYLAVAIRASGTDDAEVRHGLVETLNMFSLVFGIPLSFGALLTGLILGLTTRWGVFRYPWVMVKLVLILTVLLVGGLVIGPASSQMLAGGADASGRLIGAATYDVLALTVAAGLGVFKPGHPRPLTGIRPPAVNGVSSTPGPRPTGGLDAAPASPAGQTGGAEQRHSTSMS